MESARIDELRRRVESDPASVSFGALAEEYRRAGRHEDAIAACLAGLVHHPGYASARVTLGRALMELGRPENARVEFERVVRAAPENLAAIRALAVLHDQLGARRESAPSTLDTAVSPAGVPPALAVGQESPAPLTPPDPALQGLEAFLSGIEESRRDP